jgi:phosphoribosylglycinamide formyltransferase-1
MKIAILASGTGSLARAVLSAWRDGQLQLEIVGLIADRECPALDLADDFSVPKLLVDYKSFPDRAAWNLALAQNFAQLSPDLFVSLGFMRILPPEIVFNYRIINTHPALLPAFPGAHAVRDALAAGAGITGSTVHWVDSGVDTGKVIAQRQVPILPADTEELLHERIKIVERSLIVETLKSMSSQESGKYDE